MRNFIALCATLVLVSACGTPTPGPGNTTGTNGSTTGATTASSATASKQAYIQALNCIKTNTTDADVRTAIDTNLNVVAAIPDVAWASASASATTSLNAWLQAANGACGTVAASGSASGSTSGSTGSSTSTGTNTGASAGVNVGVNVGGSANGSTSGSTSGSASGSASGTTSGSTSGSATVSGDIYASQANYFAFLDCAGKKDATALTMANLFKSQLQIYNEANWAQTKILVQATHKSFVDTYGAGCM